MYEGSSLKFFNHPEGYTEPKNPSNYASGFNYIYQYKDHLGNVRLSYQDINGNGSVNTSEILEENNYYPFGLQHKGYNNNVTSTNLALKRKFGGKEYQDELGLGWYDITARNYDPALGRWMNLDPLAEQMRRHSPYNYAFDNPIFFIDRDGMAPDDIYLDENGKYLGEDGARTNNVRVIYGSDFNQVKSDNSGSTISLNATSKLQSMSNVVTVDAAKIQNDINDVNNETINDQSAERQTYITLNIDSKSAGNPTAVVTSQRGANGVDGEAIISSDQTRDGRNTINGQQNVLIGQVHSHNLLGDPTKINIPGTSTTDVNAASNLNISVYSIDSYKGELAISVPSP